MKHNKPKRLLALLAAIVIVVILLILVISYYGDPFTHQKVKDLAQDYMKAHHPEIVYEIKSVKLYAKTNEYQIELYDKENQHEFTIHYSLATEYMSDTYFMDSCNLLLDDYQKLTDKMNATLSDQNATIFITIDCSDSNISLDTKFDTTQTDIPVTLVYDSKDMLEKQVSMDTLKQLINELTSLSKQYQLPIDELLIYDIKIPMESIEDETYLISALQERNLQHQSNQESEL